MKFTNKKLIEFIPYNTYNNLDYKKRNGISMKSIKKKNQDRKITKPNNISDEDYEIILNVLLDEILGENSTKKDRNNKVSEVIDKIKKSKNQNVKHLQHSYADYFAFIVQDFMIENIMLVIRKEKIRKVNNIEYIVTVNEMFKEHKGRIGSDKIAGLIKKNKYFDISQPTVSKIMVNSHLYVNSSKKPKKFKEDKNTKDDFDYLVGLDKRKNLKPLEAASGDFMVISNNDKHYHLHMISDIKTGKILAYNLSDNQSAKVVLKDICKLPNNISILNTNYGRQYFDKEVRKELKKRNIRQSMGIAGKSNDNLWIEYILEELDKNYSLNTISKNYQLIMWKY
ncbi:hypothetical protein SAM46_03585 [Mycoplasmopsis verecunda]|uniref:DDE-type integrase/transposase/recombinase n=1 Tax=Mycoplasmopsis verecunda TaxID=171291 RepID=UPI00298CF3A4|nr:DDE-type integrase/transposase/recombinase [Mycoplasmopsis verecunda]WPB54528.1 hypothetical protein SAM46_03585 [Mycoplasmopsis verecunda]